MDYRPEDIFTPQGILEDVEHNPNLDFLMNVFNIPRAFGVSGFGGNWNVGQHSFATALIALFWAKFNQFSPEKRDRLVSMALIHDLHESVTGDILPMFKADGIKERLNQIQGSITQALGMNEEETLLVDLKIIDLIAFLYEIKQVSPSMLHPKKLALANTIAERQRQVLLTYCDEKKIERKQVKAFMEELEI